MSSLACFMFLHIIGSVWELSNFALLICSSILASKWKWLNYCRYKICLNTEAMCLLVSLLKKCSWMIIIITFFVTKMKYHIKNVDWNFTKSPTSGREVTFKCLLLCILTKLDNFLQQSFTCCFLRSYLDFHYFLWLFLVLGKPSFFKRQIYGCCFWTKTEKQWYHSPRVHHIMDPVKILICGSYSKTINTGEGMRLHGTFNTAVTAKGRTEAPFHW